MSADSEGEREIIKRWLREDQDALTQAQARIAALEAALVNTAPYASLQAVADILDSISVASWESSRAYALGWVIGRLRALDALMQERAAALDADGSGREDSH